MREKKNFWNIKWQIRNEGLVICVCIQFTEVTFQRNILLIFFLPKHSLFDRTVLKGVLEHMVNLAFFFLANSKSILKRQYLFILRRYLIKKIRSNTSNFFNAKENSTAIIVFYAKSIFCMCFLLKYCIPTMAIIHLWILYFIRFFLIFFT